MAHFSRADTQQLEECLRIQLDEIWRRYEADRNPKTKAEYLQLLKQFADLVLRGKL